jgi:hypothetical protein
MLGWRRPSEQRALAMCGSSSYSGEFTQDGGEFTQDVGEFTQDGGEFTQDVDEFTHEGR